MPKRKTTQEFNTELKELFPNLELIGEYNGDKNYLTVKCTIHDYVFKSKPVWLRHGHGCQKCYDDRRGNALRRSLEDVIADARKTHGNKYDYSKITDYKNGHTKVSIICPIHGEFEMTMNHHINGQGCPRCAGKYKTTEEVIKEFIKVHGDEYDYSKVEYKGRTVPVCIICPKHGEFLQTPDNHLEGKGCPKCNSSKLEKKIRKFLLDNKVEHSEQTRFDWLGKQSLDFFLPQYNIAIECQGEQHFKDFSGTLKFRTTIDDRIRLDITKKELCDEHNIKLLYVMQKRWKDKSLSKRFNGIYSEKNIILDKEVDSILLDKIKARLT